METNWFKKHPALALLLVWTVLGLVLEGSLRIAKPSILYFTYQARQVHGYSPAWKVDYRPNETGHFLLKNTDGQVAYDFIVTASPLGTRVAEAGDEKEIPAGSPYVHCIGDSFTMGWAVPYEAAYPTHLQSLLSNDYEVLNLGLDGFGAIAATEKSMALWETHPAEEVVYLFSPNDFGDDELVMAHRSKSGLYHGLYSVYDALRRHTYVANLPTAIKWYAYFEPARRAASSGGATSTNEIAQPSVLETSPAEACPADHPTAQAVLRYARFIQEHDAKLHILILGDSKKSRSFFAFCQQEGLPARRLLLPKQYEIPGDGHYNSAGNRAIARMAYRRIAAND